MVRSELPLRSGEAFGCEFSVVNSPLIDISAVVVNKIGNLYGARLQTGPLSESLLQDAIDNALASGHASVLSINDLQGRKVMRVIGGLTVSLRNDFLHSLTKMTVDDLDLSGVTEIDQEGVALCHAAVNEYKVQIVRASACVRTAMGGRGVIDR